MIEKQKMSAISLLVHYFYYLIGFSAIIIPLLIWIYIEYREYQVKQQCKRQNLPYVRIPAWNFAVLFGYGRRFDLFTTKAMLEYGKIFGFNMWNRMTISIADPELVQIVCNREFTKFPNRRVSLIPILQKYLDDLIIFLQNKTNKHRTWSLMIQFGIIFYSY